jgi:hypothetical protein
MEVAPRRSRERDAADELIDELVPEGFDWERLVRSYPLPALAVAAAGGFLLGRSRGREIVAALAALAAGTLARGLNQLVGEEIA